MMEQVYLHECAAIVPIAVSGCRPEDAVSGCRPEAAGTT
jgi:hypothetical protein